MINRFILLFSIFLFSQSAWSQANSPGITERVNQFRLALDIEQIGMANKDAFLLVSAARLKRYSRIQPFKSESGTAAAIEASLDIQDLLLKAKEYAAGREDLLAFIQAEAAIRSRATTIGPRAARLLLRANETEPIQLSYFPGRVGLFGVSSNRIEDLNISIENSKGENICKPVFRGSELICELTTTDNADVRVQLTNRSAVANMITFFHD